MMRILTVKQPWAWAIVHGGKDVENRVRNLAGDYRGPVAIHAGQSVDMEALTAPNIVGAVALKRLFNGAGHPSTFKESPRGAIIGVVDLVGVHNSTSSSQAPMCWGPGESIGDRGPGFCSPWAMAVEKHLELANPRPLVEPIPYKGALGMRTLPGEVEQQILAALTAQTGEDDG